MNIKLTTLLLLVLPFIGLSQINDSNIQDAVNLWVSDQEAAISAYGNISEWDVSDVTDMDKKIIYQEINKTLMMIFHLLLDQCFKPYMTHKYGRDV